MNLKAFAGVFAVALLVLAAVPGSTHAEVADPTRGNLVWNLFEKYDIGEGEDLTRYLVEEKPESELTWKEAYIVMMDFTNTAPSMDPQHLNIDKAKHYGDLMLQKEDTKQTRVLYNSALSGAYYSKYKQTKDPAYIQDSIKYGLKIFEEDPSSGLGINWKLKKLKWAGYDVSDEALSFSEKMEKMIYNYNRSDEDLTTSDLKELGYFEWKEEQIMPIVEQDPPVNAKIAEKLPVDKDSSVAILFGTVYGKYIIYGFGGLIGLLFVLFILGKVKGRR